MDSKKRRWLLAATALVAWFLAADGYWSHKERAVAKCATDLVTTLHQGRGDYLRPESSWSYRWDSHTEDACSFTEGRGAYWNSMPGLAYWEILVLIPVIHRVR
jgi:hypothetical protein